MAYFSTEPASERRDVTGKNRIWDFFRLSSKTHPANRRQPLQPRRKNRPTPTKTVSGIPYWPSRDPMGEDGGENLYGMVYNDPVDFVDCLGKLTWVKKDTKWVTQWGDVLRSRNQDGGILWDAPAADTLAYTVPIVFGKFSCKKDSTATVSGCWKLNDSTVTYNSEVVRHTDRWYKKNKIDPAWIVRAENDHVSDFDKWATLKGKPVAELAEIAQMKKGYSSKSACEEAAAAKFRTVLQESALVAVKASIVAHDDSKEHSWGDPKQRP